VIRRTIERGSRIKAPDFGNAGDNIDAAAGEMQRDTAGPADRALSVVEIAVQDALRGVVIDRGSQPARERVAGAVGDAADVEWPEADADDERVARTSGFGQGNRDCAACRRLLAGRSSLNDGNRLRVSVPWIKSGDESE